MEVLGDLALLSQLMDQTSLVSRIDAHYPSHHLWQGPSVGKIVKGFLLYILSENDHRLYKVEDWARSHLLSLRWLLSTPDLEPAHFSDDHLGILLDKLSQSVEKWERFQRAHNESLLRFYDLGVDLGASIELEARIDSTTIQAYRPVESAFQIGHNAKGSALPQLKAMLLAIDKANLALALNIVPGNQSDDQLYIPTIELAWRQGLPPKQVLIVGDGKLANQANTAFIDQSGNYYLSPLVQRQYSPRQILASCQWIQSQEQAPEKVYRKAVGEKAAKAICLVKELSPRQLTFEGYSHQQRLIGVCVLSRKQKRLTQLASQIEKAQAAVQERMIRKRGRKTLNQAALAREKLQQLLTEHKVAALFELQIDPPKTKKDPCQVQLNLNQEAYEQEQLIAGWRVFGTNAPKEAFSPQQAVLSYWEEYRIEQQFHLLLNKTTALRPIFLKKENRISALMNLMMIAIQFSNLWEYTLRKNLKEQEKPFLTHLVPGNPGKKVYRPTTAMILTAFKHVQWIAIKTDQQSSITIRGIEEHHLRIFQLLAIGQPLYLNSNQANET